MGICYPCWTFEFDGAKFQRDRQPFNACSFCLRVLGLAPKQLEALHA